MRNKKFLLMFLYIESLMRLAVHVGGDVVSLLRRQAAWIRLGHVVLNEGSHFPDLVHASAVAIGVWPPEGRDRGWLARALCTMTQRTLLGIDLAAAIDVAGEFGQLYKSATRKRAAGYLVFGKPLRIGNESHHFAAVVRNPVAAFTALKALLDPLFECDNLFFTIAIHREQSGNSNQRNRVRRLCRFSYGNGRSSSCFQRRVQHISECH